ncbi:hypothetical protein C4J81_02000 [Deltaproteobacteria bacterium Smac51]|nr:hypothetical protein C4J81_02000 [Deltaproteobacteria bacterium Smac51]
MSSYVTGPSRSPGFKPATARRILPQLAERLQGVVLENLPWERLLKLYDSTDTFFFVDPPYICHNEYRHNLKRNDFAALASALSNIKGRFLLTHTDSPEIRAIFADFRFEQVELSYTANRLTRDQKRMVGKEVLISNY